MTNHPPSPDDEIPAYENMGTLGEQLNLLLGRLGSESASAINSVFSDWKVLVGEHVAAHVTPIKIEHQRLHVEVDEASWATQMRFLEPQLLASLSSATASTIVGIDVRVKRNTHTK
jgi:predicted nucleic acid-binding Zn ribbon protein